MQRAPGGEVPVRPPRHAELPPLWRKFSRAVRRLNVATGLIAGALVVFSAGVITNEVIWRYFLHHPHTWNLELNIFLLIGATFLAANYTQMRRGHVGTEVLQAFMPKSWDRWRVLVGDVLSALFCAFLAIKVLEYDWQAWQHDWRTDSTWAPPLWVPYTLMGVGLVLISIEYIVQITEEAVTGEPGKVGDEPR